MNDKRNDDMSAKKKKWMPKWAQEIGVLFGGQAADLPVPTNEIGSANVAISAEGQWHFGIQELLEVKAKLAAIEGAHPKATDQQAAAAYYAMPVKAAEADTLMKKWDAEYAAMTPEARAAFDAKVEKMKVEGWKALEPQIAAILKVTPHQLYRCRKCGGAMQEDGEAATSEADMVYQCVGCGKKKLESVLEAELEPEVAA